MADAGISRRSPFKFLALSLSALLLAVSPILADPPAAAPPVTASIRAWDKPAPTSAADLLAIQKKVQDALPAATAATVGIVSGDGFGSGVIVNNTGLVLTAAHVIASANHDVQVILKDGSVVKARTLGVSPVSDAGMVQITDKRDWPSVPVADSTKLKQGAWCFAVGYPGGHDKTRGPVVRVGRIILWTSDVLWTDCKLLGGDSGGPLFDLDGKVIGIHSRISLPTEANFHVSLAAFHRNWNQLLAGDFIRDPAADPDQPMLGVVTGDHKLGAVVEKIIDGSAAHRAGIKVGDIITQLDTQPITNAQQFGQLIRGKKINDPVKLQLLRGDQKIDLEAKLGARGSN
jgi:serine protease Do